MDFQLSKEQMDIKNAAREFAMGEFPERAQEFDREEKFDLRLRQQACKLGFVGVTIGEKYGGLGLGQLERCLITEEFWAVDAGIGVAIESTTFGSELIEAFGAEEQKQNYLCRLANGEAIMGTAISEADAGSDVTAAITSAVREGNEYVINGSKIFSTNGNIASFMLIFCLTNPENPNRHKRHSFFIAETDRPGYEASKLRGKLGIRASDTAELSLNNLRVPASHLIGGQEGEGFKQVTFQFNMSRTHVCAQAVGIARAALEEAIKYTKSRHQFGVPLSSFQVTQFKLAEMATRIRAARNLYYEAVNSVDNGRIDHGLIAMAKWFSGEVAVKCADEALQMHGGYGYLDDYKVQRIYRDAKIVEIYEGTKEIEKMIVARSLLPK